MTDIAVNDSFRGPRFGLGLDFGTGSVRALLVDTRDGAEVATAVFEYPSGENGVLLDPRDPNVARQHPGDYLTGLVASVREALALASQYSGFDPARIVGIGVAATGSTPMPVDQRGIPLGCDPRYGVSSRPKPGFGRITPRMRRRPRSPKSLGA